MKLLTIIGARPQFIKAAVLSRLIINEPQMDEVVIHTGQHFDANMSEVFFQEMGIPNPKYNLNIHSKGHGEMTGLMMVEIEKIVIAEQPDWMLVYGDTNSTLAGALVASKLNIKLAHVEAGLRSFNNLMPEEINRILTDRVSDILLCPTQTAIDNLLAEGFGNMKDKRVLNVGDIMYDAALYYLHKAIKPKVNLPEVFYLATIHRPQNTDNEAKLIEIFNSLNEISKKNKIVLPIHPRTKEKLSKIRDKINVADILFIDPVGYLEMNYLLQHCQMVFTDSGGVQKEAFFFKKPCITLRNETEWIELVENRYNVLVGNNVAKIDYYIENKEDVFDFEFGKNLYGKGDTGRLIIETLKNY